MVGVAFLLPLIFVLLSGLVSVFLFLVPVLFVKQERPKNIPDGSMGWPIIGETLGFLKPHKSNSLGSFLQDHCSKYGRIFKSHLFGHPTIVSCDHDLNMFILQNEERLFQCSYPQSIHGVLGSLSLLCAVGDLHKRLRSFALLFMNTCKSNVEYIINDVDNLTISMMESWKDKKEVIFCEEVKKFTFSFIVKRILSMEPEEVEATKILEDYHTFMKGVVSLPLYIPGSPYTKAVKARVRISTTIKAIIKERIEGNGNKKGDYLDALLSDSSSSDEEKVSLVLDLLLGGYETTSVLIALTVYFLGYSPHALQILKEEHQAIRTKKEEEALNLEDYKQMQFTQNVINEALRCGNVVKFVHRKALKDVNYKGFLIPSGWKVLPIFAAAHLDPSVHENPTEFNPWRWHGQDKVKSYAPFSGGLRLCPGAEIAKVETAIFLHHLVLNFRWRTQGIDYPLAKPYVEFFRGLRIAIEPLEKDLGRS